jgi:23S rRNA pseudouridine1911/1915/1917 synthase
LKYIQNIQIIHEDNDLLVVNKPAGLSTESGTAPHPSCESILRAALQAENPKRVVYLRAVHRLDRPVSGVLVLAKKKNVLTKLMTAFEQKEVQKTYIAQVRGEVHPPEGTLTHWLARDETGRKAVVFPAEGPQGQRSEISYKTLDTCDLITTLRITPHQGRFHQIRAQLAAAGWPIIGDTVYGGEPIEEPFVIRLHAETLRIGDLEWTCSAMF